jgi:metal-responsive CopG/Arc/MetJ family transcriptional regulator
MTVSVRLDPRLERELEVASERLGLSKSEIIKQSLESFLREKQAHLTPWELGKDLFGHEGSGVADLARNHSKYLKEKVRAKNAR